MKPVLSVLILTAAISVLGCDGEHLSAPTDGLSPLPVVVAERTAAVAEPVPAVRIFNSDHGISFQVTTQAACATIVNASYRAQEGHVDIVAYVGGNPLANCAPIPWSSVADYGAVVPGLEPGSYSVSVFEARGGLAPRLIGSGRANSFAPAD